MQPHSLLLIINYNYYKGVTDADIEDAVECGRKLAMKDIEMLGMGLSLERNMEVETESAGSI